jgi:mRNA-degrading endonuclease toxin of MazEF toxin-antitoxin module
MKRGDVVLANLPFIGATGSKLRPALVVQDDLLNRTIRQTLIAEITSNLAHVSQPHQVLIDISTPDGAVSGLLTNSAVRCNRLHLIPQADVRRIIGSLSPSFMRQVEDALKSALGIP